MNKILILGGTGMLGAPVTRRLQVDGFEVRLLTRDPEKARAMFDDSYEIVAGDVIDGLAFDGAVLMRDTLVVARRGHAVMAAQAVRKVM